MNDELCPRCGVDWGTVRGMLVDGGENYSLALVICQNCSSCREHFRAWLRGKPFEIKGAVPTAPCLICGAEQASGADGRLVHAPYTKETWALHYRAHEEEVRQSIIRERAKTGNKPPQIKPVFGGWYS